MSDVSTTITTTNVTLQSTESTGSGSSTLVSSTPTGPAGGDLTGQYPSPVLAEHVLADYALASDIPTDFVPASTGGNFGGNLGIGAPSPGHALHIADGGGTDILAASQDSNTASLLELGTNTSALNSYWADSSVIRMGDESHLYSWASDYLYLSKNVYLSSSGFRRISANPSSLVGLRGDEIRFQVSGSGSAGGLISDWETPLSLTNTAAVFNVDVEVDEYIHRVGDSGNSIRLLSGGVQFTAGGNLSLDIVSSAIAFSPSGTERFVVAETELRHTALLRPGFTDTTDLGSTTYRYRSMYTGLLNANEISLGLDGQGDSEILFYDDTNDTQRSFRWTDATSKWEVEDSTGTMQELFHGGNTGNFAVKDANNRFSHKQEIADDGGNSRLYITDTNAPAGPTQMGVIQWWANDGNTGLPGDYEECGWLGYGAADNTYLNIQNLYDPVNGVRINDEIVYHHGNDDALAKLDTGNIYSLTSYSFVADTSDGSDTKGMGIFGGGSAPSTRGGSISVFGNENASYPGQVRITSGDTGSIEAIGSVNVFVDIDWAGIASGDGSGITNVDAATLEGNAASAFEPAFSKNTAFNKNFGTTTGTVAEGDDSRILNGQTAYGWGDHAAAGYVTDGGTYAVLNAGNQYTSSNFYFGADTSDGADTKGIGLFGGGTGVAGRGASFMAFGNEHGTYPGQARIVVGDTGTLEIIGDSNLTGDIDWTGTASGNGSGITNVDAATLGGNAASAFESAFSKNTAFNKNFGTTTGTVAEGDDSRILNGQTAYGWGDHSAAGYLSSNQTITLSGDVTGSGSTAITTTIASAAVEASMLNNNVISGQTALTSGLESTDELILSDAGSLKRMDVSVLEQYLEDNLTVQNGPGTYVGFSLQGSRLRSDSFSVSSSGFYLIQGTIWVESTQTGHLEFYINEESSYSSPTSTNILPADSFIGVIDNAGSFDRIPLSLNVRVYLYASTNYYMWFNPYNTTCIASIVSQSQYVVFYSSYFIFTKSP